MKRIVTIAVLLTLISGIGKSQVSEETRVMALGNEPSVVIDIPDTDVKFVETQWKEFMKKYGRVKNVRRADEVVVSGAQVLNIGGASTLDIYARTEQGGSSGARQIVWIDMGDSFVNSDQHRDAYDGTVELLEDFAHYVKVEKTKEEMEEKEKELEKLESKLTKLRKDNDAYNKDIEQAKERIAKAQANIEKNLQDQEIAAQEIEAQQKVVEEVRERLNRIRSERNN